jgi:TolB-like protein
MSQVVTSLLPHRRGPSLDVHMGRSLSVKSVHAELEKILTGEAFVHCERLKRFLRLAVEEVLQGRGGQLKEYLIGVEVFDRHHSYDPQTDPIVRVEAYRLRSKLEEYYRTEGRRDQVSIELPKGRYVPVFRKREPKISEGNSNLPKRRTIAVLTFADLSREKDQEYFCCGIAADIITGLTKLDGLCVVSRTAGFQFRSKAHDVRAIQRGLKAEMVLEGSVQKVGERVRVTVQLSSVSDGYHLWSEKYDREMKDVFGIQDEISKAIVKRLRTNLASQQSTAGVKRHSENQTALAGVVSASRHKSAPAENMSFVVKERQGQPKEQLKHNDTADLNPVGFSHGGNYSSHFAKFRPGSANS